LTHLLYAPQQPVELADLATVGDQQIENDAVIFMVFKKGGDSWENIELL